MKKKRSKEDLLEEFERLTKESSEIARKAGITGEDILKEIEAYRAEKRKKTPKSDI